jgi:hypothetical protein
MPPVPESIVAVADMDTMPLIGLDSAENSNLVTDELLNQERARLEQLLQEEAKFYSQYFELEKQSQQQLGIDRTFKWWGIDSVLNLSRSVKKKLSPYKDLETYTKLDVQKLDSLQSRISFLREKVMNITENEDSPDGSTEYLLLLQKQLGLYCSMSRIAQRSLALKEKTHALLYGVST